MRQRELLTAIQLFQKMTSTQLKAWMGIPQYIELLLTKAKKRGLIRVCPSSRKHERFLNRLRVWELTDAGEALLGTTVKKDLTHFKHAFHTAEIHFSFRMAEREVPGLKFLTEQDILNNPKCPPATRLLTNPSTFELPSGTLKPDFPIFGFEYQKSSYVFGLLEIDNGNEQGKDNPNKHKTLTSMAKAYNEFFEKKAYKTQFGLQQCSVFFVFNNEATMRLFQKIVAEHAKDYTRFMLMRHMIDFDQGYAPADGFAVTTPWERVGHEPFDLVTVLKATTEKKHGLRRQAEEDTGRDSEAA